MVSHSVLKSYVLISLLFLPQNNVSNSSKRIVAGFDLELDQGKKSTFSKCIKTHMQAIADVVCCCQLNQEAFTFYVDILGGFFDPFPHSLPLH